METFTDEVKRLITGDRRKEYGEMNASFSRIATMWSGIFGHPVTTKQVALCMIQLKVCREVNKSKHDNRIDIAGYAMCLDMLEEVPF